MSTLSRDNKIVSGLRSGKTFRQVAEEVGVHHRTAQRVAERSDVYSARSYDALPSDFNTKGLRVYKRVIKARNEV